MRASRDLKSNELDEKEKRQRYFASTVDTDNSVSSFLPILLTMNIGSLKCIFPSSGSSKERNEDGGFAMNLESLKCGIFPATNRAVNDSTESTATVFPLKKAFHKNFQYPHSQTYWEAEAKNYRHALLNEVAQQAEEEEENYTSSRRRSSLPHLRSHSKKKSPKKKSSKTYSEAVDRIYLEIQSARPDRIQLRDSLYEQHRQTSREQRYQREQVASDLWEERNHTSKDRHYNAILDVQDDDQQNSLDLDFSGFSRPDSARKSPGLELPPPPKSKELFQEYLRLKAISDKYETRAIAQPKPRIVDLEDPRVVKAALRRSSSFGSTRALERRSGQHQIPPKESVLDSLDLQDPIFVSESTSPSTYRDTPVAVDDARQRRQRTPYRNSIHLLEKQSSQHSVTPKPTLLDSLDLQDPMIVSESSSPSTYRDTPVAVDDARQRRQRTPYRNSIHLLEKQSNQRSVTPNHPLLDSLDLQDPMIVSESSSPLTYLEDRIPVDSSSQQRRTSSFRNNAHLLERPSSQRSTTKKHTFRDSLDLQDPMVVSQLSSPPASRQKLRPVTPSPRASTGAFDDSIVVESSKERVLRLRKLKPQSPFVEDRFIPAYTDSVIIRPASPQSYSNYDGYEPDSAYQEEDSLSTMSPEAGSSQHYPRHKFQHVNEDGFPIVRRNSWAAESLDLEPHSRIEAEPIRVQHLPMKHSEYPEFFRPSPPSKTCLPNLNKEYLKRLPAALTGGRYKTLVDSPQLTRYSQRFGKKLEI
jgi:hypothetical protein